MTPKLQEVAARNKAPRPPAGWACDSRRHLVRLVPPIPGLWLCFTHSSCVCNDIVSAVNRVVAVVPLPTPAGLSAMRKACLRIGRQVRHVKPWSYEQVLAHFTGSRRRRYEQAYAHLQSLALTRVRHARISSFVKSEKFNPNDKVNPDPRMIQARTPEYGLEIARYLKPIEHWIYRLKGPLGLRMIAKGLNQRQRAELLLEKMARFSSPVVMSLDCSRWDKHCTREVLLIEHAFYLRACHDPVFQQLLSWQLDNRCCTNNGVRYAVEGGRMSGDMNTALGNCVLAVIMAYAAMADVDYWDILDDGDDLLLICEESVYSVIKDTLARTFLTFGQELKVENVARRVEDVIFCQSRVVWSEGPIFVRDWRKVLSHAACGVSHWGEPSMVRPMLTTVGLCELALNAGVPILQSFAESLIRNGRGSLPRLVDVDRGYEARIKAEIGELSLAALQAVRARPITSEARVAFMCAFGVSTAEQLWIEGLLSEWTITSTVARLVPPERDSEWADRTLLDVCLPTI